MMVGVFFFFSFLRVADLRGYPGPLWRRRGMAWLHSRQENHLAQREAHVGSPVVAGRREPEDSAIAATTVESLFLALPAHLKWLKTSLAMH